MLHNTACHPGGHYWDNYPGVWSSSQVNASTFEDGAHVDDSVWLQILSRPAIWAIWIWRSTARLKFVGAIYFNDVEKLTSLNSHLGYKILRSHSPEELCIALAIRLLLKSKHRDGIYQGPTFKGATETPIHDRTSSGNDHQGDTPYRSQVIATLSAMMRQISGTTQ